MNLLVMDEKAVQYLNFLPLQLGDAVSKLATLPQPEFETWKLRNNEIDAVLTSV